MDESWLEGLTALVWKCPPVMGEWWGSTTPKEETLEDLCREYSVICAPSTDRYLGHEFWQPIVPVREPDGPFLEVRDGHIVAEWWRGGRWPVEELEC